VAAGVLGAAALFGSHPSVRWLALILLGAGAALLALHPALGLLALVLAALVGRAEFGTGTAVAVNPATLLVPALLGLWVLVMVLRRDIRIAHHASMPAGSLPWLAGPLSSGRTVLWDLIVPAPALLVVQIAQWAILLSAALADGQPVATKPG
jgi:hypothetical protein